MLLPWLEQQGFKDPAAAFHERAGRGQCAGRSGQCARAGKEGDRAGPEPAAASHNSPTASSPRPDYEMIQDEALLDEWITEATKAGTLTYRLQETDGPDS